MSVTTILGLLAIASTHVALAQRNWSSPAYNFMYQYPLPIPPVKEPLNTIINPLNGVPIDYYEVDIKSLEQQIYPDRPKTRLIGYDGLPLGPTFKVQRGRESVIRFMNHAQRENSVHLHGGSTRSPWDGWAEDLTSPGQYKDYYFSHAPGARTLWYHDHAVDHTSDNLYRGQAGLFIIEDPEEDVLGLPYGEYDVPLAIIDRRYAMDASLPSIDNERNTFFGDVFHVNGQPWPYLNVEPRKYRFRLLNIGPSRDYMLSVIKNDGQPTNFSVIASDSGLLRYPVNMNTLSLTSAERWEIVLDFSGFKGQNLTLRNQLGIPTVQDFPMTNQIMRFVVGDSVSDDSKNDALPEKLRQIENLPDSSKTRLFTWGRDGPQGDWQINNVSWSDVQNRILSAPVLGATEIWTLQNTTPFPHPVHLHLVDFEVLSRTGGRNVVYEYEKAGLKDVILLNRGETIQVKATFQPWDGLFMFHCHNTVHEDHAMMAAFNVTNLKGKGYDGPLPFVDPMDPRFRAVSFSDAELENRTGDFSDAAILDKLYYFASLNAYKIFNKHTFGRDDWKTVRV